MFKSTYVDKLDAELEINSKVDWVLWHISPCKLFNAKSCLYKNIKYDL